MVERRRLTPLQVAGAVFGLAVVFIGAVDLVARLVSRLTFTPPIAQVIEPQETVAASETSTPATSTPLLPTRLALPALSIDAPVEQVGLNARGAMAAPSHFANVAWYKNGARPGDLGNAVLAGHLNNAAGTSGIFENLHKLSLGDVIEVRDGEGKLLRYAVREMTVYPESAAPREKIFVGDKSTSRLVLITCNGAWDHNIRSYDKRLVVFAERL
jgi:sortase A